MGAQAAVLLTASAGIPAVVMAGLVVRLLACTLAARLLEMGIERLQQALSVQNPKLIALLNVLNVLACLALRGWLVAKLFPVGESVVFRGLERVRLMDIVEGPNTKVIYEYRPVQWTRQVMPLAVGAQVAGLAGRVACWGVRKGLVAFSAWCRSTFLRACLERRPQESREAWLRRIEAAVA
jgi:hypothetical protein